MAANAQAKNSGSGVYLGTLVGLLAAIALCALTVTLHAPDLSHQPAAALGAATALAIIAGGAVAIERIMEGFWTGIDMWASHATWPLGPQADKIRSVLADMDKPLETAVKDLEGALATASSVSAGAAPADLSQAIKDRQAEAQTLLKDLQSARSVMRSVAGSSDSATVKSALTKFNTRLDALTAKYPELLNQDAVAGYVSAVVTATADVQGVIAKFESNPARKLLSILAGAVLGLALALGLGLNVFSAAAATPALPTGGTGAAAAAQSGPGTVPGGVQARPALYVPATDASGSDGSIRGADVLILVTGLVMGLGATPTHELIQAIQQFKQNQTAAQPA